MKRIEKAVKKQLDENKEAIDAIIDKYVSSFESFKAIEEKNISEAKLNAQKILTDLANRDSDDVISDLYGYFASIDDANNNLEMLNRIGGFLFEDVKGRKSINGFGKHDENE